MKPDTIDVYRPRALSDLGLWEAAGLRLKVYGLCAAEQALSDRLLEEARVAAEGEAAAKLEIRVHDYVVIGREGHASFWSLACCKGGCRSTRL